MNGNGVVIGDERQSAATACSSMPIRGGCGAAGLKSIGERFDHQIDSLTEPQLTDYFTELVASHSWIRITLYLFGLSSTMRASRVSLGWRPS